MIKWSFNITKYSIGLNECLIEHSFEYKMVPYSFPAELPIVNFKQIKFQVQTSENPKTIYNVDLIKIINSQD